MGKRDFEVRHEWNNGNVLGIVVAHDPISQADLGHIKANLAYCVTQARAWVQAVLGQQITPAVRARFAVYFASPGLTNQQFDDKYALVLRHFTKINNGIRGPQEVKYEPMAANRLGCTGGGGFGGKRRIHLNTSAMLGYQAADRRSYCAFVYLHEASHKYCHTEDHAYLNEGFLGLPDDQKWERAMTRKKARDNADSYAGFAVACAQLGLAAAAAAPVAPAPPVAPAAP